MPAGSFDLDAGLQVVAAQAQPIAVYLYYDGYSLLPNVRCLGVEYREGPEPPLARFQYILDDNLAAALGWPGQFQDLWPIDAIGPYIVNNDDRLVVASTLPDGSPWILFDGFALMPQVDVSGRSQSVSFTAVGVAIRCFDQPITGSLRRNCTQDGIADLSGDSDIPTDLPCHFNPADHTPESQGGFLPNCINAMAETDPDGEEAYPVFIDPLNPFTAVPNDYWTVGKALRYILSQYNGGEEYVVNPDFSTIDDDVMDFAPAPGYEAMNPDDPGSYVTYPVPVRDYDASNKPWPVVVADLLGYAGFCMAWDTGADADGDPVTTLAFYRRDEFSTSPDKMVYLDEGTVVGQTPNNATGIRLVRDSGAIINAFQVETAQRQVEISMVIEPLFQPQAGDETATNRVQFIESNQLPSTDATTRRKYRWFGADELGEGHLGINPDGSQIWRAAQPCLFQDMDGNPLFEPDDDGSPSFVQRYRPGHRKLISQDSTGRPMEATLTILLPKSAEGSVPMAIDPVLLEANDWTALAQDFAVFDVVRGWELLPDRLGIRVTADDPEEWSTGNDDLPQIQGVTWWANPSSVVEDGSGNPASPIYGATPLLVLTVTIDDDLGMGITAPPLLTSPTVFPRWRVVDARDHFKYTTVSPSSRYYAAMGGDGTDPLVVRDDTEAAQAHANQLRSAREFPYTAGTITVPYISGAYDLGDQIFSIGGRRVTMQTNVGIEQLEAPTYPWIVGISFGFENDRQTTALLLSDKRSDHEARNSW